MKKYLLIDANIAASYYLPMSAKSKRAAERIEAILDNARHNNKDYFIYIPNFCIAETISTFNKYTFSKWGKTNNKKLDARAYESIIRQFQKDIHNGKFIYHYELNRYHILGINFTAPIDYHYKVNRNKNKKINPASTFDHLIISMGIQLSKIHGPENVCILTTDYRLGKILERCKNDISDSTLKNLKMNIAEKICSTKFSKNIFPKHLNLHNCKNKELEKFFGIWPLKYKKPAIKKIYKYKK